MLALHLQVLTRQVEVIVLYRHLNHRHKVDGSVAFAQAVREVFYVHSVDFEGVRDIM